MPGEYKTFMITKIQEGAAQSFFATHAPDDYFGIPFGFMTLRFNTEAALISHLRGTLDTFDEYLFLLRANIRPKDVPRAKKMFWQIYAASQGMVEGRAGEMARLAIREISSPLDRQNKSVLHNMAKGLGRL